MNLLIYLFRSKGDLGKVWLKKVLLKKCPRLHRADAFSYDDGLINAVKRCGPKIEVAFFIVAMGKNDSG